MSSWRTTKAREELAELEAQCRIQYDRGNFVPTREGETIHHIWVHWEYHRLSEKRREARERLWLCEKLDREGAEQPANDNERSTAER
jgi:hypothetical protein